jgi:hypothetical protein
VVAFMSAGYLESTQNTVVIVAMTRMMSVRLRQVPAWATGKSMVRAEVWTAKIYLLSLRAVFEWIGRPQVRRTLPHNGSN